ncbi:hypothetical protein [Alkaliphilus peptidifermentans]|uniref:Uncharacterized protein n=1 Tax=Alkaliphilus peptidifermentans DSM 18978 TaxID=1120976 RepID=A0A1G5GWW7_9FIRM|nr:hypothetical protein [Alkaliphilus peptidifermentans]SCY55809.1 hypothetical protein SAMN03080606_01804 [Alkaliphilus peptidifermentans DSM 18978]
MKKSSKEIWYLWGSFWSVVIGLIVSKVYLTWAFLFYTEGYQFWGFNSWTNDRLWMWATENHQFFMVLTLTIFISIGCLFVKFLIDNGVIKHS